MIKKLSQGIVKKMNSIYPRSEEDNQKIEYYIESLLDQLLVLVIVFILCGMVGYHKEALICYAAWLLFRSFAGGLHFNKRIVCLSITGGTVLVGGYLIHKFDIPFAICLGLLLLDLILVIVYAPQVTKNNPITEKFRRIRKIESIILICIYAIDGMEIANN